MIDAAHRRRIESALWPQGNATPGTLWAVLDCARDSRIHPLMMISRVDHQCLYSGELAPQLKVVAPHLVELTPGSRWTATVLDEGWCNQWCICVRINDATRLRHHLRKLLTVLSEDGHKLLFRFYDPRVLRLYLPTCQTAELEQMFGPISQFFVPGCGDGDDMLELGFDGSRLLQRTVATS